MTFFQGDIVLVKPEVFGGDKERPVIIIQSDLSCSVSNKITFCAITSIKSKGSMAIHILPDLINHLDKESWILCDEIHTVRKDKIKHKIGRIDNPTWDQIRLNLRKHLNFLNFI